MSNYSPAITEQERFDRALSNHYYNSLGSSTQAELDNARAELKKEQEGA